jgi:hypothetical protein
MNFAAFKTFTPPSKWGTGFEIALLRLLTGRGRRLGGRFLRFQARPHTVLPLC